MTKKDKDKKKGYKYTGAGMAIGITLGVALGIALDNMAFVAIGITLGAAFEGANKKEVEKKEKQ
ncbi:hypothetical protein ACW66K_07045 [Aerococcus urinaeequi]|nr:MULTISPECIES: hypothetical protein [Aerococcus]MCT1797559.1 hypothetical protein [Aerococcus viridans]